MVLDQFCGMDSDVEGQAQSCQETEIITRTTARARQSQTSNQDIEVITRTTARADRVTDK